MKNGSKVKSLLLSNNFGLFLNGKNSVLHGIKIEELLNADLRTTVMKLNSLTDNLKNTLIVFIKLKMIFIIFAIFCGVLPTNILARQPDLCRENDKCTYGKLIIMSEL